MQISCTSGMACCFCGTTATHESVSRSVTTTSLLHHALATGRPCSHHKWLQTRSRNPRAYMQYAGRAVESRHLAAAPLAGTALVSALEADPATDEEVVALGRLLQRPGAAAAVARLPPGETQSLCLVGVHRTALPEDIGTYAIAVSAPDWLQATSCAAIRPCSPPRVCPLWPSFGSSLGT